MTASAPVARPRARWILPEPPDPAVVRSLCDELLLPEPICRLLALRGHVPAESAKRYQRPRLEQLLPPGSCSDPAGAVAGLLKAPPEADRTPLQAAYDVPGHPQRTWPLKAFAAWAR